MREALRILVAEDDADLLSTVSSALELWGHEVIRVDNGIDLIEHLAGDEPFDLVISDISMPWITGLHVLQSARYAGFEVPVIVMTALRGAEIPEQVRRLGSRARLLQKPFDLDGLRAAVDHAMEGHLDERWGAHSSHTER
jgi:two-component system response regulator FlrC